MRIFKFTITLFLIVGTVSTELLAQPTIYSPTSRIGLGQILDYEYIAQDAMGGISAAYHDNVYANPSNAASLSWLRTASLDIGVYGSNNTIEASDGTFEYWSGNITHLSLAFPIFNPINDLLEREERDYAWGMMLGLQPYSVVGYDILVETEDEEFGRIQRQYTGDGGTYVVMWGNGFRYKNIAIGVRAEYLFGDLKEERSTDYIELLNSYQNIYREDLNLGALRWDFGAQYKWVLKRAEKPDGTPGSEQKTLTFGATMQSSSNLKINESRFYRLEHNYYDAVDTLLFSDDNKAEGVLPGSFSAGIFYQSKNKWDAGVDFNYEAWENYQNDIRPADLRNTWGVSAGLGVTPDASSLDNYLKRMTYRAGFNYGLDPRVVNDKQIKDYSISLGFTLPFIGRRRSAYGNFSFKYGERAVADGISETYFRIGFGFTASDNHWFVQSKFD